MEHIKRFIFILFLFIGSVVVIHSSRTSSKAPSPEVNIACLPLTLAERLQADTHLKWDAQIAYNTVEQDETIPSYRCYISLPATDVVCAPQQVAQRKDLQECPSFPALWSSDRICYFLNQKHYDLQKKLSAEQRLSILDLPGIQVSSIEQAKKVLKGIR